jgi:hypothetical protein
MKKAVVGIALCAALIFCMSGPAAATLINVNVGGERVVYDTLNDLYWYPILTDFTGMTRAEQEAAIDSLVYAGSSDWQMATWVETSTLKYSLAEMATVDIMPTEFWCLGTESLDNRTVQSPYLAWEVYPDQFFTPTMIIPGDAPPPPGYDLPYMGDTLMFNGRTADDAWGWRSLGDGSAAVWAQGDADDHFVAHSFMTGLDNDFATMMFNYDQHYLPDDYTISPFAGPSGAWAVTTQVPEAMTLILLGFGLVGLAGFRRKFQN